MEKHELMEIVYCLIDELREIDDGTVITIKELMNLCGFDLFKMEHQNQMELCMQVHKVARKRHISLKPAEKEDLIGPWPWSVEFIVRNKKAQIMCPRCGSRNTARIMFGMPAYNEQLKKKLDSGKVVLGGCCLNMISDSTGKTVMYNDAWHCNNCKKDFGKPAYLISNNGVEDYREIIKSVCLTVESFSTTGNMSFTANKTKKGVEVIIQNGLYDPDAIRKHVSDLKWNAFLDKLFYEYYLFDWKKNYTLKDCAVLDGSSWTLSMDLSSGRKRTWKGSNAYPGCWGELMKSIKQLAK